MTTTTDIVYGRRNYYVAAEASLLHAEQLADKARTLLASSEQRFRDQGPALQALADTYTALSSQALALAVFEITNPDAGI
jgi:hypothetical protein